MKRLFILIAVCMIGMVLPQGVFAAATVTVSDGTVTINAEKAGDLKAYLQSATPEEKEAISSASTIVFKGKYNSNDLQALSDAECCTQSTVNMSEAYFVKSSSTYNLYHNTPSNPQDGKLYVIGSKKYVIVEDQSSFSLQEVNQSEGNNWQIYNVLPEEKDEVPIYSSGSYIKLPETLHYYQMVITTDQYNNSTRSLVEIVNPTPEQKSSAKAAEARLTTNDLNQLLYSGLQNGEIVKVRSADCSDFKYFKSVSALKWVDAQSANQNTYSDGETTSEWYSSIDLAPIPTTNNGQVVYAGGNLKVCSNGQLVDPSQVGGNEEYDYTQMSFSYWGTNVKTAITSNYVLSENDHISSGIFSGCTNLENITLGSGVFDFKIGNASEFTKIKSIEVKKDVRQLGSLAQDGDGFFPSSSSLSTVTFEMGGTTPLKLGKNCFNTCTGIGSVTLPARTQLIEELAFGGTSGTSILSEVRFNNEVSVDYPMVIKSEAFYNQYNITDVWVDIDPDVRPLVCEYEAFDFHTMDGQTYPANPMAVLHFNEAYWDYYAGNWKKGMTLTHEDLLTIRDGQGAVSGGQSVTKGTNSQLVNGTTAILGDQSNDLEKTGQIKDKQPANGWQQFARTSTGIDIVVTKGKYYRTYSTPSALVKPDWMKIYRVNGFDDGFTANSDASSAEEAAAAMSQTTSGAKTAPLNITVTGTDDKAYVIIPENTGVIRVDERTSDALYYFLELERTSAGDVYKDEDNKSAYEYPYSEEGDKVNFMYPTKGTEATIGPVEKKDGMIAYRIFGLLKQTTSGVSPKFARALVGTKLGDHRAYLKLPAGVFHWKNEKVGTSQNATGDDVVVDENNTYAKISLLFDDDFEELNGGIATAIINSIEEDMYKNDSFYTLQGVKVAKPTTKGVYIHNGKKILIK